MTEIKHILFPVDLSEACRRFAADVRLVTCRTGARLTLLSTLELPDSFESNPVAFRSLVDISALMRRQKTELNNFVKAEFSDMPALHRVLRRGDPAKKILDYADSNSVDLIMLPTQGVGPLRRLLIGSTAAKVLHDAACPVWTSAHAPQSPQAARLSKILCAIDLSDQDTGVIQYAEHLAQTFGAQLRFLNVINVGDSWATRHFEGEFVARLTEKARGQMHELLEADGRKADFDVTSGDIARSLRQEALDWNADLIVIGRGILPETFGRLRSETYKIIRESPCQVVSVAGPAEGASTQ